jgi:hypothetical protein
VGISAGIVPLFRSPVTLAVSQADFLPPVSASKNSVPRGRVLAANAGRVPGILGVLGGQKARRFEARSVIIADSIQGLQTAGSILAEHREVARPRRRVAAGLRPPL